MFAYIVMVNAYDVFLNTAKLSEFGFYNNISFMCVIDYAIFSSKGLLEASIITEVKPSAMNSLQVWNLSP